MAGFYGLHYFMFWCVVVASGSSGQSDGGICGVVSRLEALQAQIASELQLLTTSITELGECDKITCPDGYTACGGMCYRLYDGYECFDDEGDDPVPRSQQEIDCLLDLTQDSSLPIVTAYDNDNGTHFTSNYDSSVVAPAELVDSDRGPGGDKDEFGLYAEGHVLIDRNSGKLSRSVPLVWSSTVTVCVKPPLQ